MDSKPSSPETTSPTVNTPGSPSSSSYSSSSFTSSTSSSNGLINDNSAKNHSIEANDIATNQLNNTDGGGSSDGGFVSGEEEFEIETGKAFVAAGSGGGVGGGGGSTYVDPAEFPALKVSAAANYDDDDDTDVDDDENVVGEGELSSNTRNKGFRMSWADIVGNTKGKDVPVEVADVVDSEKEKPEVSGGKEIEKGETVLEPEMETDAQKFNSGEDIVVEAVQVDLPGSEIGSGVAYVGGVEESKSSVDIIGDDEVLVDDSVPLDNGFDKISGDVEGAIVDDSVRRDNCFDKINGDVEGPVDAEIESVKNIQAVTRDVEVPVAVDAESGEGENSVAVVNDSPDVHENSAVKIETADDTGNNEKEEKEFVPETDDGIKQIESAVETAASASDIAAVNGVDGEDNDEVLATEPSAEISHTHAGDTSSNEKELGPETGDGTKPVESAVETATNASDIAANGPVDGGDRDVILATDPNAEISHADVAHDLSDVIKELEDEILSGHDAPESAELDAAFGNEEFENENEDENYVGGNGEDEGSVTDGDDEGMIFGSSEAAKQFLEELERGSAVGAPSGAESSRDISQMIDGQVMTDSDEEVDTDEEGEGKELFDSAALAALLKAATSAGSEGGSVTVTAQDGSRLFSVERPAGLGSSLRPVKPAARSNRPNLFSSSILTSGGDSDNNLSEEEKKKLEKLQQLRVKFLRLVYKLGHSPEESIAAQVLYRLALVAGRQTNQLFSLDAAKKTALQLEEEGKEELDFSLNILVLGKTGVGKSATINSIFGEQKSPINAFEPATNSVREITGVVDGIKIRVIDSPGLKSSGSAQGVNRKLLSSVNKLMKKCPPDIVLYVDRLDSQTRDLNDLPLLRSITSSLGSSVWRNAVVTLTHAASAPPDGPSGSPLSYEVFVAQRSHVVQQSIGQAVGDLRLMNPSLMNPVSLVENHPSCRKNRDGQKVLPNGQTWRPQLLMLCYSMKILSEASSLSKPQDPFDHRKLFGFRSRAPPLPYLLSWLLQSRTHPKLSTDQGGDSVDSDVDLADLSDSDDEEEEDEYDQLPPFKPLRKNQLAKLSKEQKKAYLEEYDYRVKLLQKKQWREELRRMKEMKKKGKTPTDEYGYIGEDGDQENGAPAAVPVPLPDMALPPSFDGDNPAFRYRFLEPNSQFLARPVLDTHGWDHDCGYDGVNIENSLAIANRFPATVAVQVTKDKKEFSIHLDSSVAAKHGESGSSMAGFDIQNVGKQLAYILRGETKFKNFKMNKTAAGVSVTFLGQNVAGGFKVEDQIALGKRLVLVGSTGTVRSQGDAAYGANLEVRLREADFPIGQDQSTLGLSLVKWRGDLALGANLQSQFSVGRGSKIAVRAGLNNKMSGQISVRTSSSDQLQIALVGLLPIAMSIYKSLRPGVSENYMY
ncbi:translocase of chloroplast 159, chloroplastic [Mercurialis annua]|uniref:translocase of chloroplast 159, chloroplastic n=1 Tax=Mercurialis annua TaxID=3986 RepID=UPI00215FCA59|nr:translocase of chloroplast 159, chloroplastic [Mercurialis annua]